MECVVRTSVIYLVRALFHARVNIRDSFGAYIMRVQHKSKRNEETRQTREIRVLGIFNFEIEKKRAKLEKYAFCTRPVLGKYVGSKNLPPNT